MKRYIRSSAKGGTGNPDEWDYSVRTKPGERKLSRKIYRGLQWDMNGHLFEVAEIKNNVTAIVTEDWISEDTGKEIHEESEWDIKNDSRSQFVCPKDNVNYRLHSIDADNSAEVRDYEDSFAEYENRDPSDEYEVDDDYDEMDEDDVEDMYAYFNPGYVPRRDRDNRDYSPSHPWDAPGMSVSDFF